MTPPPTGPGRMTRVLIADDHPLFRNALQLALDACVPDADVREAENL